MLLHGLGANLLDYVLQYGVLAESYRVIGLDLVGHGWSDPPGRVLDADQFLQTTAAALESLEVGPVTLVGHSLGGGIALELAKSRRDLVKRLVLIGAAGFSTRGAVSSYPNLESLLPRTRPDRLRLMRDAVATLDGRSTLRAAALWCWAPGPDFAALRTWLSALRDGQGFYLDRLDLVRVPTLVMWGAEDHISPFGRAEILDAGLPAGELVVFSRSGHFPHVEEVDRFNSTLLAWLPDPSVFDGSGPSNQAT